MTRAVGVAALVLLGGCSPRIVDAVDAVGAGAAGAPDVPKCDAKADRDGDGSSDCDDACPDQPHKTEPGLCGCALPDDDDVEPGVASCTGLIQSLVHRYTFDGTGTAVHDAMGGADGTVMGATLSGSGAVTLAGRMSDEYVDLPNGLISGLDSVTLEAWLTWYGGYEWQRIFDFGNDQTNVEGNRGAGSTYLFCTPRLPDDGDALLRVAYQRASFAEMQLDATRMLPPGLLTQVVVTFDAPSATLAIYLDGGLENSKVFEDLRLSAVHDINDWLGRSQYAADPELGATIEEFRIYNRALSAAEVHASSTAGQNPSFLPVVAP
ncbi:MAG TPA: LamG domain-containing protein [Polyangiaceae bacterium]|jgi:hypothetical protein|nr:LamG domain-containing protein [Polyangiaceae bacterium]